MKPGRLIGLAILFLAAATAWADGEYSFDATAFEKKPFEIGGYAQIKQESLALNPPGPFYKLGYYQQPQRETLDRTTGTLELLGKLRQGIATFDFHTFSDLQRDPLSHDHDNLMYEAALSVRPEPGMSFEAGKRTLRWGKGYAWNPMGFVERPKDPNDPDLGREGFVMADADMIFHRPGALQTIAFTPVLVPVFNKVNGDFGTSGHLNPAAKLYFLYDDTDIDLAWAGKGSRAGRFGADFSRNLASNFEIHGEWTRIRQFTRPVTDSAGHVATEVADATSYLLGLRYLTEKDTTWIAEYYVNGTGYSADEARAFYLFADQAIQSGNGAMIQKALSLGQGSYGRPNAGARYLYVRAQQKDALGIVYFQPAVTATVNLDDRSWQVTPELDYMGMTNLELRLRLFLLHGDALTDFGSKQNARKLELYARYFF